MLNKRTQTWGLCILIFSLSGWAQRQIEPENVYGESPAYHTGRILVKLKSQASLGAIADLDATPIKTFARSGVIVYQLGTSSVAEALAILQSDRSVLYSEPDYQLRLPYEAGQLRGSASASSQSNDPSLWRLWGLDNSGQTGGLPGAHISAASTWNLQTQCSPVVAVLDTGTDYNHPDLAANMWSNSGEIEDNGIDDDQNGFIDDYRGWDFANDDNNPYDDNGHGTHVSGTIGAVGNNELGIAGVCWDVKIMPLKCLNQQGGGYISNAIEALEYALDMGAKISNNSYGSGGFSQAFYDTLVAAQTEGHLFVTAAGNSARNISESPYYPASYDLNNVVSVAATDHNDRLSIFSNYSMVDVDLAAPGGNIYSTYPDMSYRALSGTSMATPHVAGSAALLWSNSDDSYLDIFNRLTLYGDFVDDLVEKVASGSRLNVYKALTGSNPEWRATISKLSLSQTMLPGRTSTSQFQIGKLGTQSLTWSVTENEDWFSVSPTSGTLSTNEPVGITVTFDATDLRSGTLLKSSLLVLTNDPFKPTTTIEVMVSIPAAEAFLPQPASYGFAGFDIDMDGEDLLISGASSSNGFSGAATIYRRVNGDWQQEQTLTSLVPYSFFGWTVAINGDLAVIGTIVNKVYIYRKQAMRWVLEHSLSEPITDLNFGSAIAIEGNELTIGAYGEFLERGRVYHYVHNGSSWLLDFFFHASDGFDQDFFGHALDRDGDLLLVGAPRHNSGKVYLYELVSGQWLEVAQFSDSLLNADASFGYSVALSDGTVLIGAPFNDSGAPDRGSAHFYCLSGGSWGLQKMVYPHDLGGAKWFGNDVDLQGSNAVIAAPSDHYTSGASYTFQKDGGAWNPGYKLVPIDFVNENRGLSVAATEHEAFVGAPTSFGGMGGVYTVDLYHSSELAGPVIAAATSWHKSDLCGTTTSYGATIGDLVKYINNRNNCPPLE